MIQKIIPSVADAVRDIASGSTILVSGFGGAGSPMFLLDALAEQGAKDLTIISNNAGNSGIGISKLIGRGQVKKMVCSFPRQPESGAFDDLYRAGKIDLELVPQGTLAERIRAGGAGIGGNLYVGGTVIGGGVRSTSSATAPTNPTPVVGDIWYNTLTDDVYRFTSDGTSTYWLDMSGPTVSGTSRLNTGQYIPSVYTTSSIVTATINVTVYDQYNITALSTATTFSTTFTTTPNDGQKLMIRVLDNGTAQTLNWNTATFVIVGTTLPTTTVATKTTYVGCIYNSFNSRWDVIAVTTQA